MAAICQSSAAAATYINNDFASNRKESPPFGQAPHHQILAILFIQTKNTNNKTLTSHSKTRLPENQMPRIGRNML